MILPYASPPLKPISQVTLQVSKGNFACSLTFQVINTDQPALLSTEASKALKVLTPQVEFNTTPLPSPSCGQLQHFPLFLHNTKPCLAGGKITLQYNSRIFFFFGRDIDPFKTNLAQ